MTPEGADRSQDIAANGIPNGLPGVPNAAPNAAEWLAEVQSLQRQVSELQQERDRAYASADNLRQLYDAEAQQHRRDVEAANQKIERLQKALAVFQPPNGEEGSSAAASALLDKDIARIQHNHSVEQLQAQLIAARQACEQLKSLLKTEQEGHEQTRQSLTAALGDTVDLLAKERAVGDGASAL